MASAAALEGIQKYGNEWRAQIRAHIPKDIPDLFKQCETIQDAVALSNKIASHVIDDLEGFIGRAKLLQSMGMNPLPSEAIAHLSDWIQHFSEAFIVDDINTAAEFFDHDDDLGADLVTALHDLYDWADYYRVLLIPIR